MTKSLFLFSFLLALLSGCASHKVQVNVLTSPKIVEAARYDTIMVSNFYGPTGEVFAGELEGVLVNAKVNNSPVYRSVSRSNVSGSRNFSTGEMDRSLMRNAASNKAQAVIAGSVLKAEAIDERSSEKRFICDRKQKADGVLAKLLAPCESGRDVQVSCTVRTGTYSVAFRMLEVESSKLVASEVVTQKSSSKACSDEKTNLPAADQLIASSKAQVLSQIKELLVPRQVQMELSLMAADDLLSTSASKERVDGALRFANEGRLDRSCEIFNELQDIEPQSVAIQYNLGVCAESEDDPAKAKAIYQALDRKLISPNEMVSEALKRADQRVKEREALVRVRGDLLSPGRVQTLNAQTNFTANVLPPAQKVAVSISGKREALVIGNSKYRASPLSNPVNDARDISKSLQQLGFNVVKVEDGSLMHMRQALDQFAVNSKNADVAIVFYAGHGIQFKGENFLVPVDAMPKTESEVNYSSLNLGQILSVLEDSKSLVNVVILDACRNNPFTRSWRSSGGKSGGLASVDAPLGTLVAYSTAPGKTAEDGGGRNGLYTGYLLKQLTVPNQKIEDVFKNVRKSVVSASNGEQTPWESSSLTGDFYFSVSK
jgi:hypothetical protein